MRRGTIERKKVLKKKSGVGSVLRVKLNIDGKVGFHKRGSFLFSAMYECASFFLQCKEGEVQCFSFRLLNNYSGAKSKSITFVCLNLSRKFDYYYKCSDYIRNNNL